MCTYSYEKMKEDIRKEMMQEITKKVRVELYDEVAEMVAHQFQQRYEDYGNRPPPSPVAEHVVPPTEVVKEVAQLGDDMDDTRPCQLYILSDTGTMLVACGTVYETATVVHGVQLAEDEVKVTVDEVVIPDVVLPMPTNEFFTVEEAFKSFVAWPRHLVGDISDSPIGQEGSPRPKKTHLSEDDSLGALDELVKIISDASMNVHWDSTTFGREAQIEVIPEVERPVMASLIVTAEAERLADEKNKGLYYLGSSYNRGSRVGHTASVHGKPRHKVLRKKILKNQKLYCFGKG
ncbi:hypothetical protein LR48_Vigan86s002400 [Vigna angularis]|uniref:DUF8039 domain-containing protein n=1 Tax=Phaseolus angularis TaxID=3914 RepID=A0A0L9T3X4_PHAAN|nr:hypothetical protein LR48_Vigan86s002400 [Vigna angularis]